MEATNLGRFYFIGQGNLFKSIIIIIFFLVLFLKSNISLILLIKKEKESEN